MKSTLTIVFDVDNPETMLSVYQDILSDLGVIDDEDTGAFNGVRYVSSNLSGVNL